MYFNIKSKYKKIIWLLIGFIIACIFISKASALNENTIYFSYDMPPTTNLFDSNTVTSGTYLKSDKTFANNSQWSLSDYIPVIPGQSYTISGTTITGGSPISLGFYDSNKNIVSTMLHNDYVPPKTIIIPNNIYYIRDSLYNGNLSTYQFQKGTTATTYSKYYDDTQNSFSVEKSEYDYNFIYSIYENGNVLFYYFSFENEPYFVLDNNSYKIYTNSEGSRWRLKIWSTNQNSTWYFNDYSPSYSNFYVGDNLYNTTYQKLLYTDFTLTDENGDFLDIDNNISNSDLPDYLSGYIKITLEPGERYVIFSSSTITSGSVFIPIEDFNNYGSRISYFDKDIDTQPYTSYIQDFTTTPDGLYARQNFDLSSYNGADFIMFSKYIYLEGEDNITSSVWVPSEMYSSIVETTPNNTGGNDFDFSYVDENGELQADIISSTDLSQPSPLISDLFTNFTTKDYGLSSIITAPIPLLQSLNNATCTNIELPMGSFGGVHDRKIILPCMDTFYHDTFGQLYNLYQTIATGLTAYFVGLAYFNKIKQLKDPYNDKIEVINL